MLFKKNQKHKKATFCVF